jgi:dihydroneopterin aldolase
MLSIQLKNLKFKAFHGVYQEESILGGNYLVQVEVRYTPEIELIGQLDQTVDYESIFTIVKSQMEIPTPLIETVAMNIGNSILFQFQKVDFAEVTIEKCNPPIKNFIGSVLVTYQSTKK